MKASTALTGQTAAAAIIARMIICPGCRAKHPDDAKRCYDCGTSLLATTKVHRAAVATPQQAASDYQRRRQEINKPQATAAHFYIIPCGLILFTAIDLVSEESSLASWIISLIFILLNVLMLRGNYLAMAIIRVLLGLGTVTVVIGLILLAHRFTAEKILLIIVNAGFIFYAFGMLAFNRRLKQYYGS